MTRSRLNKLLLAAACAAMFGAPLALAQQPPADCGWQRVVERVWVPARYEVVDQRVWVAGHYDTHTDRVWIPARYTNVYRHFRLPCGAYEGRWVRVQIAGTGVWGTRPHRVWHRGHYANRQIRRLVPGTGTHREVVRWVQRRAPAPRSASGFGRAPSRPMSAAQARLMALRAARVDALRRLGGVPGTREVSSRVLPDGSAQVILAVD